MINEVIRLNVFSYMNKQDLPNAMDEVEATEKLQLDVTVNRNKSACRVETCSATLGTGKKCDASIHAGFQWLMNYLGQNFAVIDERVRRDFAEQRTQLQREHKERIERIRKQREER